MGSSYLDLAEKAAPSSMPLFNHLVERRRARPGQGQLCSTRPAWAVFHGKRQYIEIRSSGQQTLKQLATISTRIYATCHVSATEYAELWTSSFDLYMTAEDVNEREYRPGVRANGLNR